MQPECDFLSPEWYMNSFPTGGSKMRKMYAVLVTAAVVFLFIIPRSISLIGEEPALSVSGLPNFVKKMDDEGI